MKSPIRLTLIYFTGESVTTRLMVDFSLWRRWINEASRSMAACVDDAVRCYRVKSQCLFIESWEDGARDARAFEGLSGALSLGQRVWACNEGQRSGDLFTLMLLAKPSRQMNCGGPNNQACKGNTYDGTNW